MTDPRDDVAREAAARLASGRAHEIDDAIAASLPSGGGALPPASLVRRHLQGIAMQALGADAYAEGVRSILAGALEMLDTLDHVTDGAPAYLMGRAAGGLVDGPLTLHFRVYTNATSTDLAAALVDLGAVEPVFDTIETRSGRVDRLTFEEPEGRYSVIRCPPALDLDPHRHLWRDEPITTLTAPALRAIVG